MTMKKLIEFSKTDSERYKTIWDLLHDHIDEKDKRLLAAAMAQSLGYGGQKVICELTGVSQATVKYGVAQSRTTTSSGGMKSSPYKGLSDTCYA